jgi:D-lactate dehydrogenase
MKITLFELESWERDAFSALREQHDVTYTRERLTADNAAEHAEAEVISTFIYSRPDREALNAMPNLRFITTRSTGYDHIDLDACRERGIQVAYVPSYGDHTVAEHAIALLLAIAHRIPESAERTRRGDFSNQGLTGFEIRGKTMGVIGTGNIGLHACRLAKGLGMHVLASDIEPDEESARDIGFTYKSLDDVLAEADVISLHVPATSQTEKLIAGDQFGLMKDGAVLINTARGSVVDVRAMVQALASGKLAGAGLDVLSEEPVIRDEAETLRAVYTREHDLESLLANHALLRLNNVIITPHNAFNTREAVGRITETTYENIHGFLDGKPINLVPGSE